MRINDNVLINTYGMVIVRTRSLSINVHVQCYSSVLSTTMGGSVHSNVLTINGQHHTQGILQSREKSQEHQQIKQHLHYICT